MAGLTIDATAGGASANSYATVAEANAFFDSVNFPDVAWNDSGSTSDLKAGALVLATRMLDTLPFSGKKIGSTIEGASDFQMLKWPRRRASGDSQYTVVGWEVGDSESFPYCYNSSNVLIIPKLIKNACIVQANYLLATQNGLGEISARIRFQREGGTSLSIPGLHESYGGMRSGNSQISDEVMRMIGHLIQRGGELSRA